MIINSRMSSIRFPNTKNVRMQNDNENKGDTFQDKLKVLRREMAAPKINNDNNLEVSSKLIQNNSSTKNAENGVLFSPSDNSMSDISAEEALEILDINLSKIGKFSLKSSIRPQAAIEHIASQYSIYKQHISKNGTTEQHKELDLLVEKHIDKYAKDFSEIVGGFFEDKGMSGERQRMFDSVKSRIYTLSESYDHFISVNPETFNTIQQKVKAGSVDLAFELRAAYREAGDGELFYRDREGGYTRGELEGAMDLVIYAEKVMNSGTARIGSEEELGMKFGGIALKGLSFL